MFALNRFMKAVVVVAGVSLALPAFAGVCWPDGSGDGSCMNIGCAPHDFYSNVDKTDRIVTAFAAKNALSANSRFRHVTASIMAEKESGKRLNKYLAIVGIDASKPDQVVGFLGERTVPAEQVSAVVNNAGLTRDQAKDLIRQLAVGVRGKLN